MLFGNCSSYDGPPYKTEIKTVLINGHIVVRRTANVLSSCCKLLVIMELTKKAIGMYIQGLK